MTVPSDLNTIHNPATGSIAPAAWGDAIRDSLEYLLRTKPSCRVTNSAGQSISNNSLTTITYNTETYDVGGMHSTVSQTSRITVPSGETGKFLLGCGIYWATNSSGRRVQYLVVNGTTTIVNAESQPTSVQGSQAPAVSYPLNAGDYVETVVFQTSGGSLSADQVSDYAPFMHAIWMAG